MTGIRPGLYWQMTWRYIGPVIMVVILSSSVVSMVIENPTYGAWDAVNVSQGPFIISLLLCIYFIDIFL